MGRARSYSDDDLEAAVVASRSWRGVLRELNLVATSSSAIRSVRQHADRLALDHSHFTGQRRWTDSELATAVADSRSWGQVCQVLGLVGGSSETAVKGHAARLELEVGHLGPASPVRAERSNALSADLGHLRRAGPLLAAAWFTLCGHDVGWPLEPCRYDLLVSLGDELQRIQVKTTTVRSRGSWVVWLSNTRKGRVTYDPDEIDYFFVIDGEFSFYLIPVAVVGGLHSITLSKYADYRINQGRPF